MARINEDIQLWNSTSYIDNHNSNDIHPNGIECLKTVDSLSINHGFSINQGYIDFLTIIARF